MRPFKSFHRDMIRPVVYQTFTRLLVTLTFVLLLREFAATPLPWGCAAAAGVFALLAWIAWLRLDGAKLPAFDHRLFRRHRRQDPFLQADMADFLEQPPVSFEELEPEERDACLLASNLLTVAAFVVIGALT